MAKPDVRRTAAFVLLAATVLGLLFASRTYITSTFYPDRGIGFGEALVPALADWYAWALLAPAMYWLVVRAPIEMAHLARRVALYLAAGAAIATVKFGLDYLVSALLLNNPISLSLPSFIYRFYANFMTYWVLIAVAHAIEYGRKYRDRRLRASQLEARLAQVQLEILRMQLQPHFLFNTLHAISTLMHRDVDAADRMLVQLGDLLRLTIDKIGVQEVSLKEELDFLRGYLEIEQTRFQDRLTVAIEIEPETLDARVPNLILQPIVENSIRHAVAPRSAAGRIEVRSRREDGRLHLSVRDDGPGIDDADAVRKEGVGLSNIRARLEGWYGPDYDLALENHPDGGLVVTLSIPYRVDDSKAARAGAAAKASR
ncbi:MAG: histidine kinase [Gemmatimonadetes bacterium]|uniref:Histidine kinase n=1 Tax=Candidatus Kutchimonas denitrificans TaxID=3056748 RepID=A0AAE4Z8K3_9BACT|nr:histidine kinase [Gemmatimonadota bacterium]NIR75653.1 histidine kinase [Candidatus Kutchimonas denitrificans]NIR99632.1 histidine kinase [Gemmatimonadota bacterium]NIT65907.1 histidine kinase [Gemmatimonadota bacterium]NIV22076.1 histidine kinase [Gemmatimonadota bacterium]